NRSHGKCRSLRRRRDRLKRKRAIVRKVGKQNREPLRVRRGVGLDDESSTFVPVGMDTTTNKHCNQQQCRKMLPRFLRSVQDLLDAKLAQLVQLGQTLRAWS